MFGHESLPSRIFRYDTLAPVAEAARVHEEIERAHRYRNDLVRAELNRRQASEGTLAELAPDLTPLAAQVAELEEQLQALRDEASARHAVDRNRQAGKASAATINTVKKDLQTARQHLKLARKEAWARAEVQAALAAVEAEHRQRRLHLRAECGVFWGTYLVCEQSCSKIRTGAPPKFQRPDGSGHLAVQIQGGMTWDDALCCRDSRFRLEIRPGACTRTNGKRAAFRQLPTPGSKRSQRRIECVAYVRIGSQGRAPIFAEVPFILHRTPPPGCRIKWVHLIRRRVGLDDRWSLSIVVSRAEGFPRPDQATTGAVGLDMGWRMLPDGDMRVAVAVGTDGTTQELRVPATNLKRWRKVDDIQSIRDQNFNEFRPRLTAWLIVAREEKRLPAWLAYETSHLHAWNKPERLERLVWTWGENRMEGDEEIFSALEKWRKRERHLHAYQDGLRARLTAWRKYHYEQFAVALRRKYRVAFVEDIDWTKLSRNPQPEEENKNIRAWYRRIASPGYLRQLLGDHMAEVCQQDAQWTTQRCHACLKKEEFDTEKEIEHVCGRCGVCWDQDENAAKLLLGMGTGQMEPLPSERVGA